MSETLWQRWQRNAERYPDRLAISHLVAGEDPQRFTWQQLVLQARRAATLLHAKGIRKGDVCALMLRHRPEFYPLYLGIVACGAVPSVLACPNPRLHPDKFVHGVSGMARKSGLRWLLTEREFEGTVAPLISEAGSTIDAVLTPLEWDLAALPSVDAPAGPESADDVCLLQHSSGTTGLQKAVTLTHRAVLDHVERYSQSISLSDSDKIVSWLPLYHDMGLIAAFQLPLAAAIPTILLDPFEWVLAPELLVDAIHAERATLSWLPNFAYNLMADRIRDDMCDGVDLSCVRMLINCSEPVRAESHRRFADRFAPRGIRTEALSACYAMAETTFAVTQSSSVAPPATILVDREALSQGRVAAPVDGKPTRACVSSGVPIPGCEVRIEDESGRVLGDDKVGQIVIRSVSMFDGYRNDPDKTAEVLREGWYLSGDLGFTRAGELFVIGRIKDLIIVAGKNLYPEDIEDAVSGVPGIMPGRVVAFGLEDEAQGTEAIHVLAETQLTEPAARKELTRAVVKAAMAVDITLAGVHLVPPRWLIKSSAGKPSRKANKQRFIDGGLEEA